MRAYSAMAAAGAKTPRASSRASALKFIVTCATAWSARPAIRREERLSRENAVCARRRGSAACRKRVRRRPECAVDGDGSARLLRDRPAVRPGASAAGLAAAHGRATTRAVHPAISTTVSRAAVADRLRMGFDKRRPPPFGSRCRLGSTGSEFFDRPYPPLRSVRPPAKRNQTVPTAPRHLTARPHAASGAYRRILPQALRSKRRAAEKAQ